MKKTLSLIFIMIFCFGLGFTSSVSAESKTTKRLWGKDRYETCSKIVDEGWKTSEYAVIVNGENFPDALSASTLAKKYNAPILLTEDNRLNINTSSQLKRLGVKKVFIVGGNFVVKPSVENDIHKLGITTQRFQGQDRNETSVAVAKEIGVDNGIILTTDCDFTDALSIGPIAAKLQMPIILMPKDSIPNSVSRFISGKNISRTYVLGESDVINDRIVEKFVNTQRIPGKNKYERNINIINAFADKIDFSSIYIAYSEKFADALSTSALASLQGNPIILVGNIISPTTKQFILNKGFSNINVIGGITGITENVLDNLLDKSDPIVSSHLNVGMPFPKDSHYKILDIKTGDINDDGAKENIILTRENIPNISSDIPKGYLYIQDVKTEKILAYKFFNEDLYIHCSKIVLGDMDGDKNSDITITSEYGGTSCMQACDIESFKDNKLISLGRCAWNRNDFNMPEDSVLFSLDGWDKLNFKIYNKEYSVNLVGDEQMQWAKKYNKKVEPYITHGPRFSIEDIDKDGVFEVGVYFDIAGHSHGDCLVGFTNYYKYSNNSWKLVDFKINGTYPVKENIK